MLTLSWATVRGRAILGNAKRLRAHAVSLSLEYRGMQTFFSYALLFAGLWFAAYAYYPSPEDRENKLAAMTRILSMSPSETTDEAVLSADVGARAPVQTTSPNLPKFASDRVLTASATETTDANSNDIAAAEAAPWQTSITPVAPAMTRRQVVRAVQRELRRTGCYSGEITGAWSDRTKRALSRFLERVNATLPLDDPDEIQLTLLRAHPAAVCGVTCRNGETMSATGNCIADVISAQAAPAETISPSRKAPSSVVIANSAPKPPIPGRMAIGGPVELTSGAADERLPWLSTPPIETQRDTMPKGENLASLETEQTGVDDQSFTLPGDDANAATRPKAYGKTRANNLQRARAVSKPAPRPSQKYQARSVQNLFQHPLGRM
jgi:hypothetical protein